MHRDRITFALLATWVQNHFPEDQKVSPTLSQSVDISLCRYLHERRFDRLPDRNPGFVGRTELLQQMEARCFSDGTPGGNLVSLVLSSAIAGTGGVGKSQAAVEFAHRNITVTAGGGGAGM